MKKLRLLFTAVGFFLFLWAGFHLCVNWWGNRTWERVRAELGARGEPVEFVDLLPPLVPDDKNVAQAPFFLSLRGPDGAKVAAQLEEAANAFKLSGSFSDEDILTAASKRNPDFQGTVKDAWGIILSRLDQVALLLDQVSQDLARPLTVWPRDSDNVKEALRFVYDSPTESALSSLAKIYFVRGLGAVASGDSNAAFDSVVALLRMNSVAQSFGPLQGCFLGALAVDRAEKVICEALARGLWTSDQMESIGGQLDNIDLISAAARSLRFERCAFAAETNEDLLTRMYFGLGKSHEMTSLGDRTAFQVASNVLRPQGLRDLERAKFFEITQSWIEGLETRRRVELEEKRKYPSFFYLRFFIQPLEHEKWAYFLEGNNNCAFAFQEELECTRLAVAVAAYRLDRGGFPQKLDDLVPAYIGQIPRLPLTGETPSFSVAGNGSFQVGNVEIGEPANGAVPAEIKPTACGPH